MTFEVRKMVEADTEVWAQMRLDVWEFLPIDEHKIDISKMLRGGKRTGYIAITDAGHAAGFAEISIREYVNQCTTQPVPMLEGIWVKPEYRRSDVGSTLISKIESDLKVLGYVELCSSTDVENIISQSAHANWGFEESDRVVFFRKAIKE